MKYLIHTFLFVLILGCQSIHYQFINPKLPLSVQQTADEKSKYEAYAKNVMISSQGSETTKAGIEILKQGGNLIDAAVAMSFVISVERPQSTGLGGGGFLLFKKSDQAILEAWDFRERAPQKAHQNMYVDERGNVIPQKSLSGIAAGGIPGLVAGLDKIHREHGKLSWQKILEPAIRLAKQGFAVNTELSTALKFSEKNLAQFPSTKKIFFKGDQVLQQGELLVQTDLAKTLEQIAQAGAAAFYEGPFAAELLKYSKQESGYFSSDDFKKYQVKKRDALRGLFKGYEIYSMPPPSSGGLHILQILNMLQNDQLSANQTESIHLIASAQQSAFADRAEFLGDPDFINVPVAQLLNPKYLEKRRKDIPNNRARKMQEVSASKNNFIEPDHTTHFTLMDQEGNVITSTQTINGYFGSHLVVPNTGVLLNNEMDDFAIKSGVANLFGAVGNDKNNVQPMKTPLSSMSPTILMKNNQPVLALGSPSGTRILTCVASVILNYLEFKMPLYQAVATIRYHHQWTPDVLRVDEPGFPEPIKQKLANMGYQIEKNNLNCRIQAISHEGTTLHGVSDPRGEGLSLGY